MSSLRRLLLAASALDALLGARGALAGGGGRDRGQRQEVQHGYKLKTVTKHGKKVKVCGKAKGKANGKGAAEAGRAQRRRRPAPPAPPAPADLFEAPGRQLNGEAAKPFPQKYLANSTFTDCATGWPPAAASRTATATAPTAPSTSAGCAPTSGSDVKSVGEYSVTNARVEPDGVRSSS